MTGIDPGEIELIRPNWPAPPRVHAATTTRRGGVSQGSWASLNLANHVQDDPAAVAENRRRLRQDLQLPVEPLWLTQVHGAVIADSDNMPGCEADGSYSADAGVVCAVLTADCLPVLLCDGAGREVAVVHAGWRGLVSGVLEAALARFSAPADEIMAWLGPAIGPEAFEVGEEVRAAFLAVDPAVEAAFRPSRPGHWLADLYALARQRLARQGVMDVYGGGLCTYNDAERFYSYRREPVTGRMASLIWLD
jgi:YfiH family protein